MPPPRRPLIEVGRGPAVEAAADPEALARYGAVAAGTVVALVRSASDLEAVAGADPERGTATAELAGRLRELAEAESATGRWVAAVGVAFAGADRGSVLPVVDLLGALAAHRPGSSAGRVAADALLAGSPAPAIVRAAGVALGPGGIDALARVHPERVGPVDAMPVAARVAANRELVRRALATTSDPMRRRALAALLADDPRTGRPRQILVFDPAGDGRVAEVFGDLDRAGSVAVVVPGMSSDLANFDRTVARPVADLARRARAVASVPGGGSAGVAVVAWLGYDPPDGLVADVGELGELVRARRAREGGEALARFVAGLDLGPERSLTLVGHSYGSTTVGAALLAGVRPRNVVVMGSPGVLVDRVAEFRRPATDFFALAADGDPVAELGWFGRSPSRAGSGFRQLAVAGTGHRAYLVDGSVAQANVAAVLLDRDDLLVGA